MRRHSSGDPISGKYAQLGRREDEKGYASYIGIEGKPLLVKRAAKTIHELASNIKDYSPNERQFI